jgi:hypothetical protein
MAAQGPDAQLAGKFCPHRLISARAPPGMRLDAFFLRRAIGEPARRPSLDISRGSTDQPGWLSMIDDLWFKNGIFYCLSVGTSRTIMASIRDTARSATSWNSPMAAGNAHPRHHRSCRQSHLGYPSLVSTGTQLTRLAIPRLVCLGRQEARRRRQGFGFPWRAEVDVDPRQGSLPSLLRFSARSQYVESLCSGGDPQDHGILDSAWRLWFPHGCGSLRDRDQGCKGQNAGRAIRHAAIVP